VGGPGTVKSELGSVTLRLAVYRQSVRLGDNPLSLTTSIFFQLNTCCHSLYVTSSLRRGWVCRLQLLLVLASAVILVSKSRGTHDHMLLFRIRDSPNLEGQVPLFISRRNSVAQLCPQALGSLSVAPYDSQGYDGGIRPSLHTGCSEKKRNILALSGNRTSNLLRPACRQVTISTELS
jgi:hypothetical protein